MAKEVQNEIETLEYLKNIVQAYEEIASIRMRRVKSSVLQNRDFLEGLMKIFYQVKYSYKKELKKIQKKDQKQIRATNGKTISVFLSANTGLYGDIITRTFSNFIDYVGMNETDVAIVGRLGKRMYTARKVAGREVAFFELADSGIDRSNIKKMLSHLVKYEKIIVFHGKFKDILVQEPTESSISGDVLDFKPEGKVSDARFIYEPSLYDIMVFFEQEIISAVFEQAVFESGLSKYASRMISLDTAVERIEDDMEDKILEGRKVKHRINNRKQLNTLAGISGRVFNG